MQRFVMTAVTDCLYGTYALGQALFIFFSFSTISFKAVCINIAVHMKKAKEVWSFNKATLSQLMAGPDWKPALSGGQTCPLFTVLTRAGPLLRVSYRIRCERVCVCVCVQSCPTL